MIFCLFSELLGCYRFCWWNYLSVAFCHFLGVDTVRQRLTSGGYHLLPTILNSTWAFYLPLFGTLINLGILYWKRHSHPWNLVLLSTFTLLEAFTLGVAISFYNNVIVLQALYVNTHAISHNCSNFCRLDSSLLGFSLD